MLGPVHAPIAARRFAGEGGHEPGALPYRTLNEVLHDAFGLAASNSNVALCDRSETGQES